jgi:predicted AAA+ superfamily ATPase
MKRFNITGTCIAHENYMVDISNKLKQIMQMVEYKEYFVINRPRQYGKTTTLTLLEKELLKRDDYLPIFLSFEGIGDSPFDSSQVFCPFLLTYLADNENVEAQGFSSLFKEKIDTTDDFYILSKALTEIIITINKKVVLVIDEVDRSSNNDLFLHFLGMLRDKFLKRQAVKTQLFIA